MDRYDVLKRLARQCSKRPVSKNFPKEENQQLANQIKDWLNRYENDGDIKSRDEVRMLRDFLLLHEAASKGTVFVQKTQQEFRYYLVIDTNIFFHDEEILSRLDDHDIFVLPQIVLDELCNRAKNKDHNGKKSQRILTHIRQFPANRMLKTHVSRMDARQLLLPFPVVTKNDNCDHQILAVSKRLLTEKKPAQLLSNDTELRKKATQLGIPTLSLREFLADY
ncbi:MAG: hypothetical protein LBQ50_03365 [Planctomycetaceae bacterium]|jgi:rRNA-processing protein FCF1|nr:hypothetical protein [Planctomycetaceae bacterium]